MIIYNKTKTRVLLKKENANSLDLSMQRPPGIFLKKIYLTKFTNSSLVS